MHGPGVAMIVTLLLLLLLLDITGGTISLPVTIANTGNVPMQSSSLQLSTAAVGVTCNACPALAIFVAVGASVTRTCTCQVSSANPPLTADFIATVTAADMAAAQSPPVPLQLLRMSVTNSNAPPTYASLGECGTP
jgi:hypothetical protein